MNRFLFLMMTTCLILVGCSKAPDTTTKPTTGHDGHEARSQHGGLIVEIGDSVAHAEAVFEADGTVRLYLLGRDAKMVLEIDAKPLEAFATPEGSTSATKLVFEPSAQSGDAAGKSSVFVGKLPAAMADQPVVLNLPNVHVGNDRYRVSFRKTKGDGGHDNMPAKRPDSEADLLFSKPGGLYTEADIKANGTKPPGEKYKGIKSKHDAEAKPGDKICPISETLANPQFTWVIGGKTYEFCCTPCIEEFVALAKEKPQSVKQPEAYRKK